MRVYGIDFTSRPTPRKPILCIECRLVQGRLQAVGRDRWTTFEEFEAALTRPGPWIAGIDAPLGQARRFIDDIGWPLDWAGYVRHAESLGRPAFRAALDRYRAGQPPGEKEHRRRTDQAAGAISPQKLYGTPVALMFLEAAPRLLHAGVSVPGLLNGDPERLVVESYPGLLARELIGRRPYKHDNRAEQTAQRDRARRDLFAAVVSDRIRPFYGVSVQAPSWLADDPQGDEIDALLCAVQAAWAWTQRAQGFGQPDDLDPLEGWIADPRLRS